MEIHSEKLEEKQNNFSITTFYYFISSFYFTKCNFVFNTQFSCHLLLKVIFSFSIDFNRFFIDVNIPMIIISLSVNIFITLRYILVVQKQ